MTALLNALILIALRVSWNVEPNTLYRVYMRHGERVTVVETRESSVILELPEMPLVSVSAVRNGRESEAAPVVVKVDTSCESYAARLKKTCGNKCRKVKR